MTAAPKLTTERLTLRLPEGRDFDVFSAFYADERSKWVGGPASREEAREIFDSYLTEWAAGTTSYFHVEISATEALIGRAGIRYADQRPEPEVAYSLYSKDAEGQGYATEAAIAVRDWGFDVLGLPTLVSYVEPTNTASVAVATRMGARADGTTADWEKYPNLTIYRHLPQKERAQ